MSQLRQTDTARRAAQIVRGMRATYSDTCRQRIYTRALIKGTSRLTRFRRATSGRVMFPRLARSTGGGFYEIRRDTTTYYPPALKLLEESTAVSRAIIHRNEQLITSSTVRFKVDDTIAALTVKVTSNRYWSEPTVTLTSPQGSPSGDSSYLQSGIKLVQVQNPAAGTWVMDVSAGHVSVEVSGESSIGVSAQFAMKDPSTHFVYPFDRRPLAGSNTLMAVTVVGSEVDHLVSASLTQAPSTVPTSTFTFSSEDLIKRLDGQLTYRKTVTIPPSSFAVTFEGQTKTGHRFQRIMPMTIVPVGVDIDVFSPHNESIYMNRQVTVPFRVSKESEDGTSITVEVETDRQVSAGVITQHFTIHGARAAIGSLRLYPGSSELATTLVALATTTQSSTLEQYDVARYLVQRQVTKAIDNTPPVCTIISTTGSCDADKIDPCSCEDFKWSGTATVRDVGSGIYRASASVNGSRGTFQYDPTAATTLPTATISSDCCNPMPYIIVVDRDSNTGVCKFDLSPGLEKSFDGCTKSESQSVGGIVGGTLGGLVVIIVLAVLLLFILRRRNQNKIDKLRFVFKKDEPSHGGRQDASYSTTATADRVVPSHLLVEHTEPHNEGRVTTSNCNGNSNTYTNAKATDAGDRVSPEAENKTSAVSQRHGNEDLPREEDVTVVIIQEPMLENTRVDYQTTGIEVLNSEDTGVDNYTGFTVDNSTGTDVDNSTGIDVGNSTSTYVDNSTGIHIDHSSGTDVDNSTGIDVGNSTGIDVGNSTGTDVDNSTGNDVDNSTSTDVDNSSGTDVDNSTGIDVDNSTGIDVDNSTGTDDSSSTSSD
ncbi:cell wall protein IFF6-like [Haliotis rufescens]|uniref:cell wall protein IFF6-like n=1 Tax=Haliotis rufescens TaxID=6454 RepID=UPI00201E8083|nr:cell wall protein IFF6-like [Haliotis rufescens]